MSIKNTVMRLVAAYYEGGDDAMENAPSLTECIEMMIELDRMEELAEQERENREAQRKWIAEVCRQPQQATPVIAEKTPPAAPSATQAKLPETVTAGADVPKARLEAPEPEKTAEKEAESADATFQGKGASEKREIFERLKAYRAERGLGCLKKLAAASNGILDEDQIRNMLDGQKETLQNWKILGAALDYEERKNNE